MPTDPKSLPTSSVLPNPADPCPPDLALSLVSCQVTPTSWVHNSYFPLAFLPPPSPCQSAQGHAHVLTNQDSETPPLG